MGKLDRSVLIKKGRVSIDGLDSLVETFRTLTGEKADAKLVSAMKYALKPLQEKVKALAPKKHKGDRKHLKATTGMLKKSISFKSKKYGRGKKKKVVGLVGPKFIKSSMPPSSRQIIPAFYAHLVERGTEPHTVSPRAKEKRKSFTGPIMPNRFKSWTHPGAKAKPFMEPALKAVGSEIFERFAQKARELIQSIGIKKIKGAK
jgi:HK97 gp10 family phage protein